MEKALSDLHASEQEVLIPYNRIFTPGLALLVNPGTFSSCSDGLKIFDLYPRLSL